ncbi:MAG: hypothetical protein ACK54U_02820, partial [Sphingomonadales bacterium]
MRRDLGEGGGINGLVFDEPLADDVVLMVRRFAETLEQSERDSLRDKLRHWESGQDRSSPARGERIRAGWRHAWLLRQRRA